MGHTTRKRGNIFSKQRKISQYICVSRQRTKDKESKQAQRKSLSEMETATKTREEY